MINNEIYNLVPLTTNQKKGNLWSSIVKLFSLTFRTNVLLRFALKKDFCPKHHKKSLTTILIGKCPAIVFYYLRWLMSRYNICSYFWFIKTLQLFNSFDMFWSVTRAIRQNLAMNFLSGSQPQEIHVALKRYNILYNTNCTIKLCEICPICRH